MHVYDVRPRKDKRGFDLISDALPFGGLWYLTPDDAVEYAKFYSRSHPTIIRVLDESGAVIETRSARRFCEMRSGLLIEDGAVSAGYGYN